MCERPWVETPSSRVSVCLTGDAGRFLTRFVDDKLPPIEFVFPGLFRDCLLDASQSGLRTSTSSLVREGEVGYGVPPLVGLRGAAVASVSEPVFVVETTAGQVVRLTEVLPGRALSEGEGYLPVAD